MWENWCKKVKRSVKDPRCDRDNNASGYLIKNYNGIPAKFRTSLSIIIWKHSDNLEKTKYTVIIKILLK